MKFYSIYEEKLWCCGFVSVVVCGFYFPVSEFCENSLTTNSLLKD